ncbi:hypothetical protein HAX54_023476, partial [Datura stramonium]|nr:hypothetical protein [Datura stramonium]
NASNTRDITSNEESFFFWNYLHRRSERQWWFLEISGKEEEWKLGSGGLAALRRCYGERVGFGWSSSDRETVRDGDREKGSEGRNRVDGEILGGCRSATGGEKTEEGLLVLMAGVWCCSGEREKKWWRRQKKE